MSRSWCRTQCDPIQSVDHDVTHEPDSLQSRSFLDPVVTVVYVNDSKVIG